MKNGLFELFFILPDNRDYDTYSVKVHKKQITWDFFEYSLKIRKKFMKRLKPRKLMNKEKMGF